MHTCQKMCLHLEKIRKTVISFSFFLFNFNNIKYVIIVIHITIVEIHAKGLMLTSSSLFYFLSFLLSQHTYMYIHDISNKLVYTMVFINSLSVNLKRQSL